MKTLIANTFVTVAGWDRAFQFSTARSYAAQYNEDQDAAHARCVGFGHDTAFTINGGTMLTDSRAYNTAKLAEAAANLASATTVADGETVQIEGETFTVRVMGRRFSDPIHFKRVGA